MACNNWIYMHVNTIIWVIYEPTTHLREPRLPHMTYCIYLAVVAYAIQFHSNTPGSPIYPAHWRHLVVNLYSLWVKQDGKTRSPTVQTI